jgi:hypothetical protein
MKKQTAVEWLVKEFGLENYSASVDFAKAIEKSQIVNAYNSGDTFPQDYHHGEDYYKKNFLTKNDGNPSH